MQHGVKNELVRYAGVWLLIFAVYLPAAESGRVSDTIGWLHSIRYHSFSDYINRTGYADIKSLYQLTQFITWCFYKVFGANAWAWHTIHCSLHALNCLLVAALARQLCNDWLPSANRIFPLAACLLYALSPYVSEVIVWEASFHYLLAMLLQLSVILLAIKHTKQKKGALLSAWLLYAISTFCHELFYTTPFIVLAIAIAYRSIGGKRPRLLCAGLFIIFICHHLLYWSVYGFRIGHTGTDTVSQPWQAYAIKAPYYFFHLMLTGRYWPTELRATAYTILRSPIGAIIFYTLFAGTLLYGCYRYRRWARSMQLRFLLLMCMLLSGSLFVVGWFPVNGWVMADRYTYGMLAYGSILAGLLLAQITNALMQRIMLIAAGCAMAFITLGINLEWRKSTKMLDVLLLQRAKSSGTQLILTAPATLRSIYMISVNDSNDYCRVRQMLYDDPRCSYLPVEGIDLLDINGGATVQRIDDSTFRVALNSYATWQVEDRPRFPKESYLYTILSKDESNYTIRLNCRNTEDYTLIWLDSNVIHRLHLPAGNRLTVQPQ